MLNFLFFFCSNSCSVAFVVVKMKLLFLICLLNNTYDERAVGLTKTKHKKEKYLNGIVIVQMTIEFVFLLCLCLISIVTNEMKWWFWAFNKIRNGKILRKRMHTLIAKSCFYSCYNWYIELTAPAHNITYQQKQQQQQQQCNKTDKLSLFFHFSIINLIIIEMINE